MRTLIDTSTLVASTHPGETSHELAVSALAAAEQAGRIVAPITIVAETMSFVGARFGLVWQRRLWDGLSESGIELLPVDADLLAAAREIDGAYKDASFGFADSVLLACCEHLRCARVLSFDRKLALYRPTFAEHLELLP